jgi:hypothetical protein
LKKWLRIRSLPVLAVPGGGPVDPSEVPEEEGFGCIGGRNAAGSTQGGDTIPSRRATGTLRRVAYAQDKQQTERGRPRGGRKLPSAYRDARMSPRRTGAGSAYDGLSSGAPFRRTRRMSSVCRRRPVAGCAFPAYAAHFQRLLTTLHCEQRISVVCVQRPAVRSAFPPSPGNGDRPAREEVFFRRRCSGPVRSPTPGGRGGRSPDC